MVHISKAFQSFSKIYKAFQWFSDLSKEFQRFPKLFLADDPSFQFYTDGLSARRGFGKFLNALKNFKKIEKF